MAKFSLLSALAIPLVPVAMFACGGDDGGKVTLKPDAAGSGSQGSGSGSQSVCNAMASYGTIASFTNTRSTYRPGTAPGSAMERTLIWTGDNPDGTAVRVFAFGNCGSDANNLPTGCRFATPTFPGAFTTLSGIDLATNGDVLVAILADLDTAAGRYNDIYIAAAGTLNITTAPAGSGGSNMFAGNASNVETVHVDDQFMEHADGCQSSITSFSWSQAVTAVGKPGADAQFVDEAALDRYITRRHY